MKVKWLLLGGLFWSVRPIHAQPLSRLVGADTEPVTSTNQPLADTDDAELLATTITGRITDDKGEGLPGASVLIKGTTVGTATDAQGRFTLTVPDGTTNGTLVVSFLGYLSQEVAIGGRTEINVILRSDAKSLDEVVVVGYGTQKREDVTGSVASVPTDRLEKIPVSNVGQALQGAVAGVTITAPSSVPGSQPNIQIRGVRSITAGTNPYLVVDGVPFPGNLNDINPNDIASIEILKDASSTAIYGTRAPTG
ncbi:TonB-dependent receptor plug domain-containing protein [Hymenobacter volaticus]|uniref:TonB-dependent receptor plug domain-containing protein n=1 Tax=Hymenobacter volaticus TaxID=2932254 RepID=A0ABY4G3S2_9BACT|nr:TonB-dependent receptor plug domain-containing protein [Hymenobacter volaticus]UOQ65463.1 TonB-dependent receptor plug domain-containing protein [Hymenobacter volaticus]